MRQIVRRVIVGGASLGLVIGGAALAGNPVSARTVMEPGYTTITLRADISTAVMGLGLAPLSGYPGNVSIDDKGRAVYALPITSETRTGLIEHDGSVVLTKPADLEGALLLADLIVNVRKSIVTAIVSIDSGAARYKVFRLVGGEVTSDGIFNAKLRLTGNKQVVAVINDTLGTHLMPKQHVGAANITFLPVA